MLDVLDFNPNRTSLEGVSVKQAIKIFYPFCLLYDTCLEDFKQFIKGIDPYNSNHQVLYPQLILGFFEYKILTHNESISLLEMISSADEENRLLAKELMVVTIQNIINEKTS